MEQSIAVNYIAPIRLSEQLMPNIVDGGTIVHVSSGYGSLKHLSPSYHKRVTGANDLTELLAIPFDPADEMRSSFVAPYKVSKAMLNRATQLMAAQNTRDGRRVSVSAVCPGCVVRAWEVKAPLDRLSKGLVDPVGHRQPARQLCDSRWRDGRVVNNKIITCVIHTLY